MANNIFDIARQRFAKREILWGASPVLGSGSGTAAYIFAVLMKAAYTPTLTDDDLGTIGSTNVALTTGGSNTYVAGATMTCVDPDAVGGCAASDVTFSSVYSGNTSIGGALILISTVSPNYSVTAASFVSTQTAAVPLLWLGSATGLPITPNDGNIIFSWDTGTNKIFRL